MFIDTPTILRHKAIFVGLSMIVGLRVGGLWMNEAELPANEIKAKEIHPEYYFNSPKTRNQSQVPLLPVEHDAYASVSTYEAQNFADEMEQFLHYAHVQETSDYIFHVNASFQANTTFLSPFKLSYDHMCTSTDWTQGWVYTPPEEELPKERPCFPKWDGYGNNPHVLNECIRNRHILVIGDSWGREFSIEFARSINQTEVKRMDPTWEPEIGKCLEHDRMESFVNATTPNSCGARSGSKGYFGSGSQGVGKECGMPVPRSLHLPLHNFTVTFLFKTYIWSPLVDQLIQDVLTNQTFDAVLLHIGRWGDMRIPMQREFGLIEPLESGICFEEQIERFYSFFSNLTLGRVPVINLQTAMVQNECTETPGPRQGPWKMFTKAEMEEYLPGSIYVSVDKIQKNMMRGMIAGHGLAGPALTWLSYGISHILCDIFGTCAAAAALARSDNIRRP